MWVAGIWSDQQVPYHDKRALSVATQIFADAKLDMLVYNGDWNDFRTISRYPAWSRDERVISEFKNEVLRARELLHTTHKAIKPKKAMWNDGNHCWRLIRACEVSRDVMAILSVNEIAEAASIPSLMKLDALKIKYSGMYPMGCWLHPGLAEEKNVWVEHGYVVRQKAGYSVTAVMDKRWSSAVMGHCERLGLVWTRRNGKHSFGIEAGNLSAIGEPGLGEGIYGGVPHSVPAYMDHCQGLSILVYDAGEWWPFVLRIKDGKCWWNGKLYRS